MKYLFAILFLGYFIVTTETAFAQAPGGVSGNLQFWVKADAGIASTTNGDPVETWEDQSGNNRDASTPDVNNPTFSAGAINFNPAINFNNNQDNFQVNDLNLNPGSLNPVHTFIIYEQDASSQLLIGNDDNNYDFLIGTNEVADDDAVPGFDISAYADIIGRPMFLQSRHVLNTSNGSEVFVNGESAGTFTYIEADGGRTYTMIGDAYDGGSDTNNMDGRIAEVIVYGNASLSSTDSQKISSYLAIKYGISLDQTSATDYLSSTSTVVWDSSEQGSYTNDIIGIGRDDDSGLDQRVSQSANTSSIITIALDDDFTTTNTDSSRTTTHSNDLQFFFLAHNNSATTTQTTELATSTYSERIAREWKVNKTNFSQTVNLKFEGFDDEWTLISDTNGDFSDGTQTEVGALDTDGEVSGSISDGVFLTLAKKIVDVTAPTLTETTPVTTPTNDTTPTYSFTSTEAGTISYGGTCSSSTTSAVAGSNTIEFTELSYNTYADCTITVTDDASNVSSALTISSFTVAKPPSYGSLPLESAEAFWQKEDTRMRDLQMLLAEIKAELLALQNEQTVQIAVPHSCDFYRDLEKGMQGEDVRCLQKLLNKLGFSLAPTGAGSLNNETVYFASRTYDAVRRYQEENASRILEPLGLQAPTGYFGPQTQTTLASDILLLLNKDTSG